MINTAEGFTSLRYADIYSHNYLFVGFLDEITASVEGATQGFKADGEELSFKNCDGEGNSYLTFYPTLNYSDIPSSFGKNYGLAPRWREHLNNLDYLLEVSNFPIASSFPQP